jgi:mannose-6-phosphate isomerase-like protein (cupin superfamily)
MMLSAVRETEPDASLVQPDMTDGDALLFDGRLWHGSHNSRSRGRRVALLLQYAAADCPVHIPDFGQLDWPFRLRTDPRPCAVLVSGTDWRRANRLVPAPPPATSLPMVTTSITQLALPIDSSTDAWHVLSAFRGPTASLTDMSCHASVLAPGHSPHPPHAHREEELLIPLHGQVELRIAEGPDGARPRVEQIGPGDFVYYPAGQHHTISNPQTSAVGYLMFKWYAPPSPRTNGSAPLATSIYHYADLAASPPAKPFDVRPVFEGATTHLGRLHAHVTVLEPGGGYEPHVDAYDVAIVTLSGTIETLGQRVDPLSVVYYAAGERHGMRNVGTGVARYLVFEFHSPGVDAVPGQSWLRRGLPGRALRVGKRLARPIWHRLRRE